MALCHNISKELATFLLTGLGSLDLFQKAPKTNRNMELVSFFCLYALELCVLAPGGYDWLWGDTLLAEHVLAWQGCPQQGFPGKDASVSI